MRQGFTFLLLAATACLSGCSLGPQEFMWGVTLFVMAAIFLALVGGVISVVAKCFDKSKSKTEKDSDTKPEP